MDELFRSALPFQGGILAFAFLLCLAPQLGRRGRTVLAALLLMPALGTLADILAIDHGFDQSLDVPNIFGRGPDGEPHLWTVASLTRPAWHWHLAVVVFFALPALAVWLARNRRAGIPRPGLMGIVVFWFFLAFRLALEATAAHRPICWAVGGTVVLVVVLPFVGYWCGRRGQSFAQFVRTLLLMAVLQRAAVIALAYFATAQHLGTHLDTHVITDINLWPFGEVALEDDMSRWLWTHVAPQSTVWIILTLVAGIVLGSIPRLIGSRSTARADN